MIKNKHEIKSGQRFNHLTIIKEVDSFIRPSGQKRVALCKCDCGNTKKIDIYSLINNTTKSCGCLNKIQLKKGKNPKKPVDQYTLEGVFVNSFDSIKEASKHTKTSYPSISYCINGKLKKANRYIWMPPGIIPTTEQLKNIHRNKVKSVYQYDFKGNLIAVYSNQKEAAKKIGCRSSDISNCITGKILYTKGFIWTNGSKPTFKAVDNLKDYIEIEKMARRLSDNIISLPPQKRIIFRQILIKQIKQIENKK